MDEVQRAVGDGTINFMNVRSPRCTALGSCRRGDDPVDFLGVRSEDCPAAERIEFPGKRHDPGILHQTYGSYQATVTLVVT